MNNSLLNATMDSISQPSRNEINQMIDAKINAYALMNGLGQILERMGLDGEIKKKAQLLIPDICQAWLNQNMPSRADNCLRNNLFTIFKNEVLNGREINEFIQNQLKINEQRIKTAGDAVEHHFRAIGDDIRQRINVTSNESSQRINFVVNEAEQRIKKNSEAIVNKVALSSSDAELRVKNNAEAVVHKVAMSSSEMDPIFQSISKIILDRVTGQLNQLTFDISQGRNELIQGRNALAIANRNLALAEQNNDQLQIKMNTLKYSVKWLKISQFFVFIMIIGMAITGYMFHIDAI
jgi:gas vesicle protein